jgi:hypothetical protein
MLIGMGMSRGLGLGGEINRCGWEFQRFCWVWNDKKARGADKAPPRW